jgi:Rrf2 family protein
MCKGGSVLSLSPTAGYAILALSYLDREARQLVLTRDIARSTGISPTYLSKILHALARSGLIEGKRGYHGGFRLARPAGQIRLMEIVEAAEHQPWQRPCLLGMRDCSGEAACAMHAFWTDITQQIESKLQHTTLGDIAAYRQQHQPPPVVQSPSGRAGGDADHSSPRGVP